MKHFLIFIFIALSSPIYGQNMLASNYIGTYQQIAIAEMNRTGIPASIKLAQGLLESNWGRSELATKSNNHFGIKCSQGYEGSGHYRYDDEYNALGQKKKSCFRVYDLAEESYIDHSNFLTDQRKVKRYGFLFEYSQNDYKSWARGLSKAGYATDPKYASKLISIIEKYELWQYDQEVTVPAIVQVYEAHAEEYRITYINSCKVVIAMGGESVKKLAREIGVSSRTIVKHNSHIKKKSQKLGRGERIYLEKKKSYFLGKNKYHTVSKGEHVEDIASLYGVSDDYITMLNNINSSEELVPGESIILKKGAKKKTRRKPNKAKENRVLLAENSDYLFEEALQPFEE